MKDIFDMAFKVFTGIGIVTFLILLGILIKCLVMATKEIIRTKREERLGIQIQRIKKEIGYSDEDGWEVE